MIAIDARSRSLAIHPINRNGCVGNGLARLHDDGVPQPCSSSNRADAAATVGQGVFCLNSAPHKAQRSKERSAQCFRGDLKWETVAKHACSCRKNARAGATMNGTSFAHQSMSNSAKRSDTLLASRPRDLRAYFTIKYVHNNTPAHASPFTCSYCERKRARQINMCVHMLATLNQVYTNKNAYMYKCALL